MMIRSRRGVSLIELMIAMVIAAGLGASVLSLLVTSTRFAARVEAQRAARAVSRSAINVVVNDVRSVDPAWGVESVSASSITIKSPYALGMVCDTTGKMTIAIFPVDSIVFATPGYSGFAWRSAGGTYTAIAGGTTATTGTFPASCTAAGVKQITAPTSAPNQKTINLTITGTSRAGIAIGSVVMLYRRVNFYFAASTQTGLTGRMALWRNYLDVTGGAAAEVVAPFDNSAAFHFYISGATTSQTTVPGNLTTMRGLELFLPGESERTQLRRTAPEQADLTTAIFFLNAAS